MTDPAWFILFGINALFVTNERSIAFSFFIKSMNVRFHFNDLIICPFFIWSKHSSIFLLMICFCISPLFSDLANCFLWVVLLVKGGWTPFVVFGDLYLFWFSLGKGDLLLLLDSSLLVFGDLRVDCANLTRGLAVLFWFDFVLVIERDLLWLIYI